MTEPFDEVPLTCEYCQGPLKQTVYECRVRPKEAIHVFCTPSCRDEFWDGHGLEKQEWPEPQHMTGGQ